jgi:hypothetical protein
MEWWVCIFHSRLLTENGWLPSDERTTRSTGYGMNLVVLLIIFYLSIDTSWSVYSLFFPSLFALANLVILK